jgi:hypothetical protein
VVVIRKVPMDREECVRTAAVLGLGSAEELWDVVLKMPANAEEFTHTFPNGNIITLRRKV